MDWNTVPLPPFVQPTPAEHLVAERIVGSHPVISAYGSVEWNELHDDGKVWTAAIVREARRNAPLSADTIARVNAFLTHMAERYRERTARRRFGLLRRTMPRETAMMLALATFDASQDMTGVAFGDPDYPWDRDHAHELVDEDLQHWEA